LFSRELRKVFDHVTPGREGGRSLSYYSIDFHNKAADSSWNGPPSLMDAFSFGNLLPSKRGGSPGIQRVQVLSQCELEKIISASDPCSAFLLRDKPHSFTSQTPVKMPISWTLLCPQLGMEQVVLGNPSTPPL